MAEDQEFIQVCVTFEKQEDARHAGRTLVEERLAGCAQVLGPIESHFHWEGRIDTEHEFLLQLKTRRAVYPQLERRVMELHPYDVAEVLAFPVVAGSRDYLAWLSEETGGSQA